MWEDGELAHDEVLTCQYVLEGYGRPDQSASIAFIFQQSSLAPSDMMLYWNSSIFTEWQIFLQEESGGFLLVYFLAVNS